MFGQHSHQRGSEPEYTPIRLGTHTPCDGLQAGAAVAARAAGLAANR